MANYKLNIGAFQADAPGIAYTWNTGAAQAGPVSGAVSMSATGGGVGGGSATLSQTVSFTASGGGYGSGHASLQTHTTVYMSATGGGTGGGSAFLLSHIWLDDFQQYSRVVAAGNKQIWYEGTGVAAGTMVELVAARDDIDTADQLVMFEIFQKVFVVNGAKLKVADFVNTKLTHSALTTAHAKGDILTQATSGAVMVVDFTDTAKTHTYGTVISGTFTATNQVTGSGSGTTFTPSAVSDGPHWYDLTVYPDGASGSLPAKAYLGCLYRGRCVLSGNPDYPYQWYMSRVANPWDWAYAANDALSPVAGGNADAGELGDVIRALIPYKDEYMIIGCANSMWVMRGDPASGGSLDEVDLTVGIFGAYSWCFDGNGNLYFMSKTGLHMIPASLGGVQPVSHTVLPNLSEDEELDPSVHRVTLAYDADRFGICICITQLSDGSNSNYFYDLRTTGIFPETYPDELGVYSALFYAANDDTLRGMLVGCTDGYMRTFDDSEKNDVGTNDDVTITSRVVLPILQDDDDDREIRMTSATITTAGTESASGSVTVNVFRADSAEAVLEAIDDGDTPHTTETFTGAGRQNRIRSRVRGHSIAIELTNSTDDSTWAVEKVACDVEQTGKVK